MRTLLGPVVLFSLFLGSVLAAENPFAGTWKLNTQKSVRLVPQCVDEMMVIPPEPFPVSAASHQAIRIPNPKGPKPPQCRSVYKFTASPDGRTLTLTQPQVDPAFKAVFDKQ
jgi:hypothetical protein